MKIKKVAKLAFACVASLGIVFGAAGSASAAANEDPSEEFGIAVVVGDELIRLSEDQVASVTANYDAGSPADTETNADIAPKLIDFPAWTACFTFNAEETVFAEWNFAWNGVLNPVKLKCGNESWGYKHIKAGKETAWQTQLNKARTYGWDGASMGVNNWDDLMAIAAGMTITYPEDVRTRASANTRCAVAGIYLMKGDVTLYQFNTRVGFATNNDRLLTTFPQSSSQCPTTN